MIITEPDGTKISSKNDNFSGEPQWKCPKCGCIYYSMSDFNSYWDDSNRGFFCNECGTDLESLIIK